MCWHTCVDGLLLDAPLQSWGFASQFQRSPPWADPVADYTREIESALIDVLSKNQSQRGTVVHGDFQDNVANISYQTRGEGPTLVLLPLSLASRSSMRSVICRSSVGCIDLCPSQDLGYIERAYVFDPLAVVFF
jgi:hypothetical protein